MTPNAMCQPLEIKITDLSIDQGAQVWNGSGIQSVILQSDLKFDQHMTLKKEKASSHLEPSNPSYMMVHWEGRFLAYTSPCHPVLEYADTIWYPTLNKDIESLEMVQNGAIRFVRCPKGRESVTEAGSELDHHL